MMEDLHKHYFYNGEELPEITAKCGYDYVVSETNIILRAENNMLKIAMPIKKVNLRGLQPLFINEINLKYGKIPFALFQLLWSKIEGDKEQFFQIYFDVKTQQYALSCPRQEGQSQKVEYFSEQKNVILEIHTHPNMKSFFSATDNRDEQGFRIYGVFGTECGKITDMSFRLGVYGYFFNLDFFLGENFICYEL
jgi:hypothetical protein